MVRGSSLGSLFGGLLLLSTSGPFFLASEMDPFTVALGRLGLAGISFLLIFCARHPPTGASFARHLEAARRMTPTLLLGSLIFVLHLLLWMTAFQYTNFASTVMLLVAQPALAALVGSFLGERVQPAMGWSLGIATVALLLVAAGDLDLGPRAWIGDGMCVLAALCTTLFFPATKRARATLPMPLFLGLVFTGGAVVVAPLAWWVEAPVGSYGWSSWGWLLGIVFLSTVGGHGLTNLAARRLSLFRLNVVILLQPLIAIGVGVLLFEVTTNPFQILGGALLPLAVAVGLWGTRDDGFVPA